MPAAGSRVPASECTAVSSSDSSGLRSGSSPGIRSASVVLPAPFGPAEQQVVAAGGGHLDGVPGVGHAGEVGEVDLLDPLVAAPATAAASRTSAPPAARRGPPRRAAGRPPGASERTPITSMPGTIAASPACGSGTKTRRMPRSAAAITIGSTPGTARSPPSRVSSPMKPRRRARAAARRRPRPARRRRWPGRSAVPRLGRSAGDSRIVTRRVAGQSSPLLTTAARQRSRASLIEASGRPTRAVPTTPWRHVDLDVDQVAQSPRAARRCGWSRTASADPADVLDARQAPRGGRTARRPGRCGPRRPAAPCVGQPPGGQPPQPLRPWRA